MVKLAIIGLLMLRAVLVLYPFLAFYVIVATLIFVPWTWVTGDIRAIYWVARQGVRLALSLSGVRVQLNGNTRFRDAIPAVFLSNHVSNIEPAVLFMVLPRIAVILKKELGYIPLLGYVMRLGGFIYVDRKDRDSRRKALEDSISTLKKNHISLLIFPEGTRSTDGELLPFSPGPFTVAIEAQAPIVPVTVSGAQEIMPKGAVSLKPGEITLVFHDPVMTLGYTTEQRAELMKQVRTVMEDGIRAESNLRV
jgi:1-acyl-sn-glycerol-3-phosphate acyltransferase